MVVIAKTNYFFMSPRKIRLIGKTLGNLSPKEAIERLKLLNKRGKLPIINVLKQAIGNAKNNQHLNPDDLVIKEILIGEGPRLKRMDKSHGARFDRGIKHKRMSHIKVILSEKLNKKESDKDLSTEKIKASKIRNPKSEIRNKSK